jgi:hypothetical protein
MNARRDYANAVNVAMSQAGFAPACYSYLTGHTQAWYEWAPGQYAVNATVWPRGITVGWHHLDGWHYTDHADRDTRHPLPFTVTAHPMDVADSARRLLNGLVQDLPANTDEWEHANLLHGQTGAQL